MSHPDEVVQPDREVPSKLIAEAQLRHETAEDGENVTAQEVKQAAVEQAHALSTRPDGSYAQLHETQKPTLAVADEGHKEALVAEEKAQADRDAAVLKAATAAAPKEGGPVSAETIADAETTTSSSAGKATPAKTAEPAKATPVKSAGK